MFRLCGMCHEPVMDHVLLGEGIPSVIWHNIFTGGTRRGVSKIGAQVFEEIIAVPAKPSDMKCILPSKLEYVYCIG